MSVARGSYLRESAGYTVETMNEHDLLEVVEIEETCGLSLWGWEAYRVELDRAESFMLVARRAAARPDPAGPRLAGFIAARLGGGDLHINNVGVRAESRRRGVGGALLRAALEWGAGAGARGAILEVRAGNAAAQALYGRYGFAVVGRRRSYYRGPAEDALVMSKQFAHTA